MKAVSFKTYWLGVKYFIKNMKYENLKTAVYKGSNFYLLKNVLNFVENEGKLKKEKVSKTVEIREEHFYKDLEYNFSMYYLTGKANYKIRCLEVCDSLSRLDD